VIGKSVETDGYSEDRAAGAEDECNNEDEPDELSTDGAPYHTSHIDDGVAFRMIVPEIPCNDRCIYISCQWKFQDAIYRETNINSAPGKQQRKSRPQLH
jgi:hypothetical protein